MSDADAPDEMFLTTRWTAVLLAGRADTPRARQALAELCQSYWYPLYAYVRRRGYGAHDAEDLTQGLFERLLKLESLADLSRERGKFRAFLLAAMNHFLADARDRAGAQKRDVRRTISLDAEAAEHRYRLEPVDTLTPERLFERRWALTLLETVVRRLGREYEQAGQGRLFTTLRFAITGEKNEVPYAELAARLALHEPAVRTPVHRLRQRYRQTLREEIAHTVVAPAEVTDELHALRRILAA